MSIATIPTLHKAAHDVLAFLDMPDGATDDQLIEFAKHLPESNTFHAAEIDDLRTAFEVSSEVRAGLQMLIAIQSAD